MEGGREEKEGRKAGGKEGREKGGKEGRREGRKEGGREGGRKEGWEGGRKEGGKRKRREGGKEGRREGGKEGTDGDRMGKWRERRRGQTTWHYDSLICVKNRSFIPKNNSENQKFSSPFYCEDINTL